MKGMTAFNYCCLLTWPENTRPCVMILLQCSCLAPLHALGEGRIYKKKLHLYFCQWLHSVWCAAHCNSSTFILNNWYFCLCVWGLLRINWFNICYAMRHKQGYWKLIGFILYDRSIFGINEMYAMHRKIMFWDHTLIFVIVVPLKLARAKLLMAL